MTYEAKDFTDLIGMPGFSEKMLKNHFKLYEGYVKNTNTLVEKLGRLNKDEETSGPVFNELQRRFGWEFNGMRLHEVYFGNLRNGGCALEDGSALAEQIQTDFGSFEAWKREFSGIGGMRGIGWASLYFDPEGGRLYNVWIDEHDTSHLATCMPILLLDVFEHAFMLDYGTDKSSYIEAFFKNTCWDTAMQRFESAQNMKVPLVSH